MRLEIPNIPATSALIMRSFLRKRPRTLLALGSRRRRAAGSCDKSLSELLTASSLATLKTDDSNSMKYSTQGVRSVLERPS